MTRTLFTSVLLAGVLCVALALPCHAGKDYTPDDIERMTIQELKERMGEDKLVIVDTRGDKGWFSSETKIKGADHVNVDYNVPQQVRHWRKGWTYVTYCA